MTFDLCEMLFDWLAKAASFRASDENDLNPFAYKLTQDCYLLERKRD